MSSTQLISLRIYVGLCCCCCCFCYLPLLAATAQRSEQRLSAAAARKQTAQPFNALLAVYGLAAGRRKRQADDYDKNADIIPYLQQPTERRFEDQIAEGLRQMEQSLVDMVKFCMEAIGQLFGGVGRYLDYVRFNELPPENDENRR